jgi:predicted RNase H-like nuclease
MAWVAGVDGCSFGWLVVLHETAKGEWNSYSKKAFAEILALPENPQFIAVDIPIGLAGEAIPGGRDCDRLTRRILGQHRGRSVFSSPVRAALVHTNDYPAASRANRESSAHGIGLSKQAFAIMPKIRDVDNSMSPEIQNRVFEVHPELCFYELNGCNPIVHGKKSGAGVLERRALLEKVGFKEFLQIKTEEVGSKFKLDDLLDASVACWTSRRIMEKVAVSLPENSSRDTKLLRMQIWR